MHTFPPYVFLSNKQGFQTDKWSFLCFEIRVRFEMKSVVFPEQQIFVFVLLFGRKKRIAGFGLFLGTVAFLRLHSRIICTDP